MASIYPVSEVFASLQGEGHFVGYPCVFVRLAGCSVQGCTIRRECDEAPWKARHRLSCEDIVGLCEMKRPGPGIVVISGGEPTDHNLLPLIEALRTVGKRVHLETSGVRSVEGWPLDWLTVSPKAFDYVQRAGHTLKVVVRPDWGWREVRALDEGTTFFHRYLQPLTQPDGTNNLGQVGVMVSSNENAGGRWGLSTQAHRLWGIR